MEVLGTVKDGKVVVASSVALPEGAVVRVVWDTDTYARPQVERQPLTKEAVDADIAWANGKRFTP